MRQKYILILLIFLLIGSLFFNIRFYNKLTNNKIIDFHGSIWQKVEDIKFKAYFINNDECKTCADLKKLSDTFSNRFPTAEIIHINSDSEEGKKMVSEGIDVLPAIIIEENFKNVKDFQTMLSKKIINPILDGKYFEFVTPGTKIIMNKNKVPKTSGDKKTLVAYVDFISESSLKFLINIIPILNEEFKDDLPINIRPFSKSLPSKYATLASMCNVQIGKIAEKRRELIFKIENVLLNNKIKNNPTEDELKQFELKIHNEMLAETIKIFDLNEEQQKCIKSDVNIMSMNNHTKEASEFGVYSAPAFFVGDLYIDGRVSQDKFISVIKDSL